MKDLLIGTISNNYTWDGIKYWINSIKKTSFSGDILLLCYNFDGTEEILQKIKEHDIAIMIPNNTYEGELCNKFIWNSGELNPNNTHLSIHMVRFFHIWQFLTESNSNYNHIISTDVRDIVFQKNPSDWLAANLKKDMLAPSEGALYKNQAWNLNNARNAFGPYVLEYILKNTFVINGGSFAGKQEAFKCFCLMWFFMAKHAGSADQAGLNILLTLLPHHVQTAHLTDDWALQCGAVTNIQDYFDIDNTFVLNKATKEPYCILHQYERVPVLKTLLEKTYEN